MALFVEFQQLLPIVRIGEFLHCLGHALCCKRCFDIFILHSKILHSLEGWEFCGFHIICTVGIQITKAVDAHDVECVQEFSTRRIAGVMRISVFVIVENYACLGVGWNVIVATLHERRSVHVREELIDCCADGVCATKGTDDSWLFQRILLMLACSVYNLTLTRGGRKLRTIVPVGVGPKIGIRI